MGVFLDKITKFLGAKRHHHACIDVHGELFMSAAASKSAGEVKFWSTGGDT
jgi:hypothetical protein